MKERLTFSVRRPRWALLPAIAAIGVLAGLTNAFAFDQQTTDDEVDNATNWQAAHAYSAPYAQVPREGTVYAPRHRSYR
jgi:hypothetical protein